MHLGNWRFGGVHCVGGVWRIVLMIQSPVTHNRTHELWYRCQPLEAPVTPHLQQGHQGCLLKIQALGPLVWHKHMQHHCRHRSGLVQPA